MKFLIFRQSYVIINIVFMHCPKHKHQIRAVSLNIKFKEIKKPIDYNSISLIYRCIIPIKNRAVEKSDQPLSKPVSVPIGLSTR